VRGFDENVIKSLDITPERAKLDFAIGLYVDDKITLGQGARIASLSQVQFLKELGKRKIDIHYNIEKFDKDLDALVKQNLL